MKWLILMSCDLNCMATKEVDIVYNQANITIL